VIEELREISFGDWDGFTSEEVAERWPNEFAAWKGSWEIAPPGGESLADFDRRVMIAKAKILSRYAGQSVVVVSHVMPIRGFLHDALDAGVSAYWRTQISPCSITSLRVWGNQEAEVQVVNYTHHLS
jgi:probable phosphoglycerate mutase